MAQASAGVLMPTRPAEAGPTNADDLPGPADLAESKVVLLTAEIRDKAKALGGSPTALNNYVATRTEYVPYLGQMQNSLAVLWSHRGNAFDQATLLIALLRASGIPARYVYADVVMTRAEVAEWMGLKDPAIMLGLLSGGLGFSLFPILEAERVVASHVWVEAYLDTSIGKGWFAMDPARKRRSFQPGIVLTRPAYDRMGYLKAFQPVLPSAPYFDAMRAELQKKYSGRGFNEVPYTGALLPPTPPMPQQPYPVVKLHFRASEVPTNLRHRINLSLTEYGKQSRYVSVDLSLPEILLQSLSLTYSPATAADRQVVEAFGGLESAPAAVVNLLPEIRMVGQVIASGKTPIATGTVMDLQVIHTPVAQGTTQYVSNNRHTAGETAAVVLGANQIGEELLTSRISSFLERLPVATAGEATRRLLDVAALRYLHRLGMETERLGNYLQVRFIQASGVENAITFASLEPQNLFDRPFVLTPGRLRIHADPAHLPLVDLNRNDQNDPVLKVAWRLHNDAASALEHEIFEEMILVGSASTIKVLQTAIRDGIPIHIVDRKNAAVELPKIQGTPSAKATMQERINKGATLTVPGRPVTIGSWKGQGWIEEYDDGWSYAYIISVDSPAGGQAPGGDTGGTPPPPHPPDGEGGGTGGTDDNDNTECTDPVNVSSGNLYEQAVDYVLRGLGPGIFFQRTYNSLALTDGPLGPGWRHNYQASLKDTGAAVVVTSGSGGVLSFPLVQGTYRSPPGRNLTLTKDAQGYLLRARNGVESRFDARGSLQSITDRNRNATQFAYEAGQLRRITDRVGRALTLNYDAKGRIVSLEDFLGRRVGYEYDAAGRLAAVTDLAGNRTVYAYYSERFFNHLLKSITTPEGRVTQFEYYGNGKAWRVTDPGGRRVSFLYLPLCNETHIIDEQGLLWSYQYNALGNVVRVIRPDGSFIDSLYNAAGKLEARTDAAGYTTRFTYDAAGNLASITDPLGRTVKFTYDAVFGQMTSIQDARGHETRLEYDARGNVTRVSEPLGAEARLTWDASGSLTARANGEGNTSTYSYDALGNPAEIRDALSNVRKLEYDRLGRLTRTLDALGGETRLEYDPLGRPTKLVDQLGRAAWTIYDREGRQAQLIDVAGRATRFGYDGMGHLAKVTDALGQVTQYAYATPECACGAAANLAAFRDAAGFPRTQTYDWLDRLTSTSDGLGHTTRFSYDARGHLVRKTDANGNVTTFEYDAAGQLTRKALSDGTEVRFSYDADGNLLSAGNQYIWVTYSYDALNRVTSVTESRFGKTIRYAYNLAGRRIEMTDPEGGVTRYAYDANQRLTSVTSPSGAAVQFACDALGRVTAVSYSNGVAAALKYDAAGRMLELAYARAGAEALVTAFAYAYDGAGNRTAITDRAGWHAYQYDELNRLTGAQHESAPAEAYTYDPAGNRKSSAADPDWRYDATGRLLAAEGATFTYDKNGNLVSRSTASGTTKYAWDLENRLIRVELPDGGMVTYRYDPFGRRIEKNVNGAVTTYLYDGDAILMEMDAGGQVTARYTQGLGLDRPLILEREGQAWFYHPDALGSIVALTDASGSLARSYAYDSWGRPQSAGEGGPPSPFLFTGREYDPETGLYYLRARYYDPALGRFLSADPLDLPGMLASGQSASKEEALLPTAAAWALRGSRLGTILGFLSAAQRAPQRLNAYAYAGNNPVRMRDPSGMIFCVEFTDFTKKAQELLGFSTNIGSISFGDCAICIGTVTEPVGPADLDTLLQQIQAQAQQTVDLINAKQADYAVVGGALNTAMGTQVDLGSKIDEIMQQAESLAGSDRMEDQLKAQMLMQKAALMFESFSKVMEAQAQAAQRALP